MAIGKIRARHCNTVVLTLNTHEPDINEIDAEHCDTVVNYLGINNLEELLHKVENLKFNTITEENLQRQTTALIQAQLSSPSKEFSSSLRNICEGAMGSALYTVISIWARVHGLDL